MCQKKWESAKHEMDSLEQRIEKSPAAHAEQYRRAQRDVLKVLPRAHALDSTVADTTLWLRTKARNYLLVARRSNDIILDLRQEKYASGILKCLDLAADLIPDQPVMNIADARTKLAQLDVSSIAKDWRKLRSSWESAESKGTSYTMNVRQNTSERAIDLLDRMDRMEALDSTYKAQIESYRAVLDKLRKKRSGVSLSQAEKDRFNSFNDDLGELYLQQLSGVNIRALDASMQKTRICISADQRQAFNRQIDSAITHLIDGDRARAKTYLDSTMNTMDEVASEVPQRISPSSKRQVVKMVYLVNDLAAADSSDDVANAIEAFALPAGSFAIKRAAVFNVAINAYPGMLGGWGYADGKYSGGVLSFTAPVGLSTTWRTSCPIKPKRKKGASFGFFIPLIDVGAVTRLQLSGNTDLTPLPELTWENLFAPGLYLHYGSPKNPISFHAGWQSGPNLKSISTDENGVQTATTLTGSMIAIGIVVDIPIWNLYTKPFME
jgi:hypothetical protein